MKNITELRKELMKREGGKKEISVAQMSEVLSHLSDISYEEVADISYLLWKNGKRRARLKK